MNKVNRKHLEKMLEDSDNFIIVSENGTYIAGDTYVIVSLFAF